MCVAYCNRRGLLYWNHEDCHPILCAYVKGPHGQCKDCRHHQDNRCLLTNAVIPKSGGCCHYNVELAHGPQVVTPEMLSLLEITADETIVEALEGRNVRFKIEGQTILVDPDDLPVPMIFGVSNDHVADDEAFDWSGWYEQWD